MSSNAKRHDLHLLSGGAAQGLVAQLKATFEAAQGCDLHATFAAVGFIRDSLLGGQPCDVLIVTDALIDQLTASGHLAAGTAAAVGAVKTGVAVKSGDTTRSTLDVSTPDALRHALEHAKGIYFPDPVKATAGIHFMSVLKSLGLDAKLADKLRPYPNGAAAMGAMAACDEPGLIGCTQITEILYIDGVELVAPLPVAFELATTYTAAVSTKAGEPLIAKALIEAMTSRSNSGLRKACGFEP